MTFYVREYSGSEVFKLKLGCCGDCADDFGTEPLTSKYDLNVGDVILVQGLFGASKFTVKKDKYGELYGDSEHNIANLSFGEDDRECWTSGSMINKACLTDPLLRKSLPK